MKRQIGPRLNKSKNVDLTGQCDTTNLQSSSDNFWSMGDTGPCGPCSEIFYDHGADVAGGPPGTPEEDGDRYIEIWNLVFMQYDRAPDGSMNALPHPSVDTGMGLERLAAILQGVHNNYDIDLFKNLIKPIAKMAGVKDLSNTSLRVIADHIRACSFLVVDGVVPSNEGRGYVLRRIIRRAIRHGHKLGLIEPFFHKLVAPLCSEMGAAYPELRKNRGNVERVLLQEEQRFAETLEQGMAILEKEISRAVGAFSVSQSGRGVYGENEIITDAPIISGETVFKLYDTYGFPVDLTADVARERKLQIDMPAFEAAMTEQRERARAASSFGAEYNNDLAVEGETAFTGYENEEGQAKVIALFREGEAIDVLNTGEQGIVVLDQTPFYAESGGQIGDSGVLGSANAEFAVSDTRKQKNVFTHIGSVSKGSLKVGDSLSASINTHNRYNTQYNHSATHLMHAALRQVLGDHVTQKGSLVDAGRLRFDFSHFEPVSDEQITAIEDLVNAQIRKNLVVDTSIKSHEDAIASGAMALFGEKYGDSVRVLSMGDFSVELCGGTHVKHTGDIGVFKIISETGVAAGVRRIEALTADGAVQWFNSNNDRLQEIAATVKGDRENVVSKVGQLVQRNRQLEKELEQLKAKLASSAGSDLAGQAVDIDGVKVLAALLEGVDPKSLRETADQLKNKLGSAAVVLATVVDEKVSLVAGVTKDQTSRLKAGNLVNVVAQQVGGKGGGRPDMAMAGGNNPAGLEAALESVPDWVRNELNS